MICKYKHLIIKLIRFSLWVICLIDSLTTSIQESGKIVTIYDNCRDSQANNNHNIQYLMCKVYTVLTFNTEPIGYSDTGYSDKSATVTVLTIPKLCIC